VVSYKLSKISKQRATLQIVLWSVVLIGLVLAKPIYQFLFTNNLTDTEPLSLFDVIQITGIVILLFMANRARTKLDALERRVQDLHQELSIRLSSKMKDKDK
jgi:hypothetical protein